MGTTPKPPADNEAVLLENRTAVVSVTGRQGGYRADLLPPRLTSWQTSAVSVLLLRTAGNRRFGSLACPKFMMALDPQIAASE
jgi:hypothetical protein